MKKPSLGELELSLLQYIGDHAPITVGEAAESFGKERGLARTTILTVMERLRKKAFLTRVKEGGLFRYSPSIKKKDLLRSLVGEFTEKALGGSLQPFIAYLAEGAKLTSEDVATLKKLVQRLEEKQ